MLVYYFFSKSVTNLGKVPVGVNSLCPPGGDPKLFGGPKSIGGVTDSIRGVTDSMRGPKIGVPKSGALGKSIRGCFSEIRGS